MPERMVGMLLVVAAVLCEAVGQLCFKRAVGGGDGAAAGAMRNWRRMAGGIGCFTVEAVLWTLALAWLPVGVAYPAGGLVFVAVAVVSRAVLKEAVGKRRWVGIGLILAGVVMIGVS